MSPQLIIAAIIATASFGGGFGAAWKLQNGIAAEKENEYVQQTLRATQDAAATAIRRADNVIIAQSEAALRERRLRADAASSRDAVGRLSHAADEALSRAQATHAACLVTASAQSVVLNQCANEYRSVAEDADRAISDRQTLIDSWPK